MVEGIKITATYTAEHIVPGRRFKNNQAEGVEEVLIGYEVDRAGEMTNKYLLISLSDGQVCWTTYDKDEMAKHLGMGYIPSAMWDYLYGNK